MIEGQIAQSGGKELVTELEKTGYKEFKSWTYGNTATSTH
jgi:Fe-S cluster assembly ATPase SufC